MKILSCSTCNTEKEVTYFYKHSSRSRGYQDQCKECKAAYNREHYKQNAEVHKTRSILYKASPVGIDNKLRREYSITYDDYTNMLEEQDNVCAICQCPPKRGRLCVDHCHTTSRVRGLLCHRCNKSIGSFEDSTLLLQRAINYLNK